MAGNEGFNVGDPLVGGRFSHLLFSDDDIMGLQTEDYFNYSSGFSTDNPPKMLCFGGNYPNESNLKIVEATRTNQKSRVLTCSDSPSASCSNYSNNDAISKSKKKRIGFAGNASVQCLNAGTGAPARSQRNYKMNKSENSTVTGHAKVNKKNIGERIAALQQLVSPYGKTDTASVLHETMGYIRFLQEQVEVLCSPYLLILPAASSDHLSEGGEKGEGYPRKDLRSRGLCLVPVECTAHLSNDNGADFWSPAMVNPTSEH